MFLGVRLRREVGRKEAEVRCAARCALSLQEGNRMDAWFAGSYCGFLSPSVIVVIVVTLTAVCKSQSDKF